MAELNERKALVIMHPTQPSTLIANVNEEIPVPKLQDKLYKLTFLDKIHIVFSFFQQICATLILD